MINIIYSFLKDQKINISDLVKSEIKELSKLSKNFFDLWLYKISTVKGHNKNNLKDLYKVQRALTLKKMSMEKDLKEVVDAFKANI